MRKDVNIGYRNKTKKSIRKGCSKIVTCVRNILSLLGRGAERRMRGTSSRVYAPLGRSDCTQGVRVFPRSPTKKSIRKGCSFWLVLLRRLELRTP